MAEENTKRIYEVSVNAADALKQLAELKLRAGELAEKMKELGKVTDSNIDEFNSLSNQLKTTATSADKMQKEIQEIIKFQNNQKTSLSQLRTEMEKQVQAYGSLGDSADDAAKKMDISETMSTLSQQISETESSLKESTRACGDYGEASKSLKAELKELTEQLQQMALSGDTSSEAFQKLTEQAQQLKGVQTNVNALVSGEQSLTTVTQTLGTTTQMVVTAWGLWTALSGDLGKNNETLSAVMNKLCVAMVALNTVTQLSTALQKTSNTYRVASNALQIIGINQTAAETAALAAKNAMVTAGSVAEKVAAAATWLWNAALSANPVMLIVTGVAALVTGVTLLVKAFQNNSAAAKESAKAMNEYEEASNASQKAISELDQEIRKQTAKTRAEQADFIEQMKQRGATAQEVSEQERKFANQNIESAREESVKRQQYYQSEMDALQKAITAKQHEIDTWSGSKKKLAEAESQLAELNDRYSELTTLIIEEGAKVTDFNTELARSAREASEEVRKAVLDNALKTSETLQKQREDDLKWRNTWRGDDKSAELKYNADLFEIQQQGERERLELRKQNGELTTAEYSAQLSQLNRTARQFYETQNLELTKYLNDEMDSIISLAGGGTKAEQQVRDITQKYTDAIKAIGELTIPVRVEGMSDEEYNTILDKYYTATELSTQLEEAMQRELAEVQEKQRRQQLNAEVELIKQEYDERLVAARNNAEKTLEIQMEMMEREIEARRELGETTYEQEAELQDMINKMRETEMRTRLEDASTDKELYEARLENLNQWFETQKERIAEEHEAGLISEAEYFQALSDLEDEWNEEREELRFDRMETLWGQVMEYANAAMDMLNSFNDFANQLDQNRTNKVKAEYSSRQDALKKSYDAGIISEEQYNKRSIALQEEEDAAVAEIERKQAMREKALGIMQGVIDTSMSILKTLSQYGMPMAIPFIAMAAAAGAAEIATIAAEPLPEAGRGRYITGPSHANGGVPLVAEGGEVIINKTSTARYLPLLSAINEAGGGVPFVKEYADGGYVARSMETNVMQQASVQDALENVRIVVTVEDIQRATAKYVSVEQGGIY